MSLRKEAKWLLPSPITNYCLDIRAWKMILWPNLNLFKKKSSNFEKDYKCGCQWQFLFLIRCFKNISSETAPPNELKLYRKHLWEVYYKVSWFQLDNRYDGIRNSCFWLADFQTSSYLKPLSLMNWIFLFSRNYCINFAHFVLVGKQSWFP